MFLEEPTQELPQTLPWVGAAQPSPFDSPCPSFRAQREQIEKERLEEEKKATGRLQHANELRRQVRENQQKQVQARIATFDEGRRLKEEAGTTLLFVSHDLGTVQMLADSLLVMRRGLCVEQGEAARVFNEPRHPYTQYLVATRLALTRGFRQALGGRHA